MESESTKVQITKIVKERENSYRTPDEMHMLTQGSLTLMFRQSQMSIPIKRVNVCEHTVKTVPRDSFK